MELNVKHLTILGELCSGKGVVIGMIAYITINDKTNLGNRLQSYATFMLLSKYDETYCLVRNYFCEGKKRRIPWSLIRIALKLKNKIINKLDKTTNMESIYEDKRELNFNDFDGLINMGEILNQSTDYSKLEEKYSCFVVGSDQIWNPSLFPNMYINMLGFVKNSRKISLASSISRDNLFLEEKYEFRRYLKTFYKLSCREERGSQIVSALTHKKCQTLIDPTLMLEKNDWISIMKKPEFHNERNPYMLVYFLGGKTKEFEKDILELGKKLNLIIIDIYDKNSIYYSCGPKEFIYLVYNASLILTDSFHGSVFSYIFDKPFKIFVRKDTNSMNSRLITLSSKLNLDKRIFAQNVKEINESVFNIKYDKKYLRNEQRKVYKYLNSSLG